MDWQGEVGSNEYSFFYEKVEVLLNMSSKDNLFFPNFYGEKDF